MTQPQHIGEMPEGDHAELVNLALAMLEKNLGIKVTAWERVSGEQR